MGDNCFWNVNECDFNFCIYGDCVDFVNGYVCFCYENYIGRNCDVFIRRVDVIVNEINVVFMDIRIEVVFVDILRIVIFYEFRKILIYYVGFIYYV